MCGGSFKETYIFNLFQKNDIAVEYYELYMKTKKKVRLLVVLTNLVSSKLLFP